MPDFDVTIIGGGPAGLACALEATRLGRRPLVLEKDPRVGGIARTESLDGFLFDLGGHRFFTKEPEIQALWEALLGADFLAGVQILVYVGGIVVVLVFAIMLTSSAELLDDKPLLLRKVLGVLAAGGFFVITVWMFYLTDFPARRAGVLTGGDAQELGRRLLDYGPQGYVLPFEIISLLLLSAAVGGMVLARKVNPKGEA